MYYFENRIFNWHESKSYGVTKPKDSAYNIKGIELEISDNDCVPITDDLINSDILTVPHNRDIKKEHTIVVESDGSVDHELIIKACGNTKLMKAVKLLEHYYHDNCDNGSGTSCHIHLNRKYLRSKGITETALFKAVEFLYPILYRVSGRNFNSIEWCRSYILHNKYYNDHEEELDLLELARKVDNITDETVENAGYHSRYYVTNLQNRSTIEIRMFSNYYNFDSEYIKLYIELCDFLMDIAEVMGDNNSYFDNYDNVIKMIEEFFNKRNHKKFLEQHNIDIFLMPAEERKRKIFEDVLEFLNGRVDTFNDRDFASNEEKMMSIIRIFRDINSRFNISNMDFKFNFIFNEEEFINNINNIRTRINEEIESL